MDALTCMQTRRSVRKFTDEPVPAAVLRQIVDVARYAPSWKNTQIARYIAVEDAAAKGEIADTCVLGNPFNQKTIARCAVLVAVVYRTGVSGFDPVGTPSTPQGAHWQSFDAGIATQTFCLAAHALGVGTVILGIYDDEKAADALHLAPGERVGALIAAGYPEKIGAAPPRKEADELLTFL